jgi:hypothetical protein
MKLSPKGANALFAVIMVGMMTFIITGVNTFVNSGFVIRISAWMHNWIASYVIALPIMMTLSPPVRKLLARYTKS